jgi:hypothetical protein
MAGASTRHRRSTIFIIEGFDSLGTRGTKSLVVEDDEPFCHAFTILCKSIFLKA